MTIKICYIKTYEPPKDCNVCEPIKIEECIDVKGVTEQELLEAFNKLRQLVYPEPIYKKL